MKRMLFNATQPEELRVALVDGQRLYDLDIEAAGREQKKANIYKAKITRLEPSLEAAFVDYGGLRHGFLPLKEISRTYFDPAVDLSSGRVNIKDVLREGQEVIVQVEKEERGNKGAALTTFISLAGRYLVLMPNNPRAGGVSRRIMGDDRNELRDAMAGLTVPDDMGLIVRTAGVGRNVEELQWDLDYLIQLWSAIEKAAVEREAPFLIYQESNVIIRAIRDYLRNDISELLVDTKETYEKAREFMQLVMPQNLNKIKLYKDRVPLFTRFQIESQIETAFQREVRLPSGGAIVIDHTEALLSIDINSSRSTKGGDIEETALSTNLEAADEIARQLRLRDLGGLIVIDFIDMTSTRNQREVENRLKEALKMDRARVQIGRISRFGLLEMSRQRLRPSLGESSQIVCPRCQGHGTVRGTESLALSILRIIEEDAMKEHTAKIVVQLPVNVATYLLNEKRQAISEIESRQNVVIVLIPNSSFESPHYEVQRIRGSEMPTTADSPSSYELKTVREEETNLMTDVAKPIIEEPAVKGVVPLQPAPDQSKVQAPGLLKRIFSIFSAPAQPAPKKESATTQQKTSTGQRQRGNRPATGGSGAGRQSQSRRKPQQARRDSGRDSGRDSARNPSGSRGASRQQERQPAKAQAANTDRQAEPDRKPQTQAQPTPESRDATSQQSSSSVDTQNSQSPQATDSGTSGGESTARSQSRSSSRRGRRGGRRRRRDHDGNQASSGAQSGTEGSAANEKTAPAQERTTTAAANDNTEVTHHTHQETPRESRNSSSAPVSGDHSTARHSAEVSQSAVSNTANPSPTTSQPVPLHPAQTPAASSSATTQSGSPRPTTTAPVTPSHAPAAASHTAPIAQQRENSTAAGQDSQARPAPMEHQTSAPQPVIPAAQPSAQPAATHPSSTTQATVTHTPHTPHSNAPTATNRPAQQSTPLQQAVGAQTSATHSASTASNTNAPGTTSIPPPAAQSVATTSSGSTQSTGGSQPAGSGDHSPTRAPGSAAHFSGNTTEKSYDKPNDNRQQNDSDKSHSERPKESATGHSEPSGHKHSSDD